MATYYGSARSNYFKVKDEATFRAWAESRGLEVWEENTESGKHFGICPEEDSGSGGWPIFIFDEDGDHIDVCIEEELAQYLQEGSVAVLLETGAEKLCYLVGHAVAVNSRGETVEVDLNDIYKAAQRLGEEISEAGS